MIIMVQVHCLVYGIFNIVVGVMLKQVHPVLTLDLLCLYI